MKVIVIIYFVLFSLKTYADLGMGTIDPSELLKSPSWPQKFLGNPEECKKPDTEILLKMLNKKESPDETQNYQLDRFVDLNLDSLCEVVVFDINSCGKWCDYRVFELVDARFSDIGEFMQGEYLSPIDGWLQIKSGGYTGTFNYFFLLARKNGKYQVVRRDEYHQDVNGKLIYKSTKFTE